MSDAVGKIGFGDLVLGGVLLVVGVPVWATATTSEPVCGKLAGCFDAVQPLEVQRGVGAAFTGMGLGLAASGGMTLGFSYLSRLTNLDARSSETLAATGVAFSSLSLATLLGGVMVGVASADAGRTDPWFDASALFTTSVVSFLVGIPMVAVGAPPKRGDRTRQRVTVTPPNVGIGPGSATVTWGF